MNQNNAPWLKFYGNIPAHVDCPDTTMFKLLYETADKFPSKYAYDFLGKRVKYGKFIKQILLTAVGFDTLGIGRGCKVGIALPNCPQALKCIYALNRIGAVPVMIHPLSGASEFSFYIRSADCEMMIILDETLDKIGGELDELLLQSGRTITAVTVGLADEMPRLKASLYRTAHGVHQSEYRCIQTVKWCDFRLAGECKASGKSENAEQILPPDSGCGSSPAVIIYSGGTTGTPKGVLLSNSNMNSSALQTMAASGVERLEGMKMLAVLPIFHGFGLGTSVHCPLVFGGECVLIPKFSPKSFKHILLRTKPEFIPGVPTLFEAMLRTHGISNADLSYLRGVFCGGDTLPKELESRINDFLRSHKASVSVRQGYGTAECVTACCLNPPENPRSDSIGIPFPDTAFGIVKIGTVEPAAVGEDGEIVICGPSVMLGYINKSDNDSVLKTHPDGKVWLHTGDIGNMDADGFFYFRQRIKRMIITSGYNVYPSQIEAALLESGIIKSCCVIGVRDDYKMHKIAAFVVLNDGIDADDDTRTRLTEFCTGKLAKFEIPRIIEFCDTLPLTAVGKVDFRKLEDEYNRSASKCIE